MSDFETRPASEIEETDFNIAEPNIREAYMGMLDLYHRQHRDREVGLDMSYETAEIGRKLQLSPGQLTSIGRASFIDFIDYDATAIFPYSWTLHDK